VTLDGAFQFQSHHLEMSGDQRYGVHFH